MNLPNDLIPQSQAAEELFKVKPQSLRKAFSAGRYPNIKRYDLGKRVYVSREECIRTILKEHTR